MGVSTPHIFSGGLTKGVLYNVCNFWDGFFPNKWH